MMRIARMAPALAAALALTVPALAAQYELFGWELNPYAGASFGRSATDAGCGPGGAEDGETTDRPNFRDETSVTLMVSYRALQCDGADTGFKLYGGLRIYEYLALEGGYVSLGSHRLQIEGTDQMGRTATADVQVEHDGGWTGSVVGMLPLARITPRTILPAGEVVALGRVGMHLWDVFAHSPADGIDYVDPTDETNREDDILLPHRGEDSGADLYFGVGGEYTLDNGVGFRLEWERYLFDGDWRKADVDMISLGAVYHF